MAATYFVKIAGKQYGPFASAGLRKLAATHHLSCDDFVSRDGNKWVPAGSVKGLSFPPVAPPKRSIIDFKSRPTFSKKHLLLAEDETAVRQVFSEKVLDALMQHAGRPGIYIEGRGSRLIYYRTVQGVAPKRVLSFVEEGLKVARLFQQSVAAG